MEKKLLYKCDDCTHDWLSTDYPENGTERESSLSHGSYCPKCGSENIGGTEIKH